MEKNMKRVLLLALLSVSQVRSASAGQLQALAGAENHDQGHQVLAFLPNELWIHEGDSVTWSFPTAERHTVSFLTPGQVRQKFQVGCPGSVPSGATYDGTSCVNSDVLMNGQTYTVTFPHRGNFKLTCLVHLYMTGVVHVFDAAEILLHDQEYLRPRGQPRATRAAVGRGGSRRSSARDRPAHVGHGSGRRHL